jgi:hypothetical protein
VYRRRDRGEDESMTTSDGALLGTLADCLESGDTLLEALGKIATARGAAEEWALRVRRTTGQDARVADALQKSNALSEDERSFLSVEGADTPVADALRAVVVRRRRARARRTALRWAIVSPFVFGALAVVLDPLPNLVTGGAYVWPVLRGLFALITLTLAAGVGIPALLQGQRGRFGILRLCSLVPGVRHLVALYAEEELLTALLPFAEEQRVRPAGLAAAASVIAWSPLGAPLRVAARRVESEPGPLPMGGLEPLAPQLSIATSLAIVGGVASKHLAARLAGRGEAIALRLTARLRLAVRIGAYALVIAFSVSSLVDMISRGLPGMPALLGGAASPDQKQLDELMKQLGQ